MKKKEIEKIPFRGGVRADKQYRNTAVAFLQDIRGENHLFVEVYENKKQELQTPWILHHCVGGDSYLNKHNTGRSTILFLRSKLAPETPYITIEICGTKILQWYGIRDTKPDEIRIERHLRRYIKALKEKDQIKSVTA